VVFIVDYQLKIKRILLNLAIFAKIALGFNCPARAQMQGCRRSRGYAPLKIGALPADRPSGPLKP
jgi:hypothetical protein